MQKCGNCKHFRLDSLILGWAPSDIPQGRCEAPVPEGHICKQLILTAERGTNCPTWDKKCK